MPRAVRHSFVEATTSNTNCIVQTCQLQDEVARHYILNDVDPPWIKVVDIDQYIGKHFSSSCRPTCP